MSRRKMDMNAEQVLTQVMDDWIWTRLHKNKVGNINSYERECEKKKQINGTDVWLYTKNSNKLSIDEKAQLYYINKNLPTFAFELSFIGQDGSLRNGWFVNETLDTNMYMLVYPYATTTNVSELVYNSFTKLECILISKNNIWKELNKFGLTKEFLLKEIDKIRKENKIGRHRFENIDWCYLNMSNVNDYSETPINIVIKREKLIQLANQTFLATKEKLVLGKGNEKGLKIF